ncbi:MAG TPA: hypothetical protein VN685_02680 [Rhizomicrobium sp.]|nr:hypothetical protein [Rhizomicrobium sp.]
MKSVSALAFACTMMIAPAQAKNCPIQYRFDPKLMYSVEDISHLAAQREILKSQLGTLVINFFDEENRPSKNGWEAAFIFYASSGDSGSNTVGGTVLQKQELKFDSAKSNNLNHLNGGLNYVLEAEGQRGCNGAEVIITLDKAGDLLFNKQLLGNISK